MTGSVTKAMQIPFINSKSRVNKRRGRKTALSGYYACLSRDLLLMALGQTHTHTHTYTNVRGQNVFKKPGARAAPKNAWFKNLLLSLHIQQLRNIKINLLKERVSMM